MPRKKAATKASLAREVRELHDKLKMCIAQRDAIDDDLLLAQKERAAAKQETKSIERQLVDLQVAYGELRGYTLSIIDMQAPPAPPSEPGCINCGHGAKIVSSLPDNFPRPPREINECAGERESLASIARRQRF